MKLLFFFALVLLPFITLPAKDFVKVGVVLPLSGNSDFLGQSLREFIQYKFAQLPKDTKFEYKLFFEDDQLIPKQTLLAVRRLVELEKVDVIMTFYTGPGSVVAPYAAQKHFTHLAFNFNDYLADGRYNFIHVTPVDSVANLWSQHAQELGYKRPAFLVHRNAGAEAALKSLEKQRPQFSLDWATVERFNQGERDFRVTLWKIKEKNPDILFIYAFEPELQIIVRQLREIGWQIPVSSIVTFEMAPQHPGLEGSWFATIDSPNIKFRRWYIDTFHKPAPYGVGVASNWCDLIVRGYESQKTDKKPTQEQFAAFLLSVKDFNGVTGTLSMSPKGILATQPAILVIKNGIPMPIEEN